MAHDKHSIDGTNNDLIKYTREDYLEMTKDWVDPYELPEVEVHEGIKVIRDDKIIGSKARFADLMIKSIKEDTIVYVQPRAGLAGASLLEVAKRYHKKVVLFMPASKKCSNSQAYCIEQGAIPKFRKIAAMPNLNKMAREWANENNAFFIPLGLKDPRVTACIVRVAENLRLRYGEPGKVYTAISTGVLSRGLQIGWENADFLSVAVARNLKYGELGRSLVESDPLPFLTDEKIKNLPSFASAQNYDAKVWKYIPKNTGDDIWFWNVGKDVKLKDNSIYERIDSQRDWHEIRDDA